MYVYVDESGNTGNRVFDPHQPLFFTAAMMTRTNFDLVWGSAVRALAKRLNVDALHANQLGVSSIEQIADDLLRIIKKCDAQFFISRLEKRYLAAAKVVDTYFDAGENLAVPWQAYWLRQLRLLLTFKLASFVITEEIAQTVWDCLTATTEARSKELFVQGAKDLLSNAINLPDEGSRKLVTEALQWAIANPDNFYTHTKGRNGRNSHSPNFVAFSNLMAGVTKTSRSWGRPVREVVHDHQEQFKGALEEYHAMFSQPRLESQSLDWPGEAEPFRVAIVPGSAFRMSREEDSPGLQVVDVVLWLFKRVMTENAIGPRSGVLLNRVFRRGHQADFSFDGVGDQVEAQLGNIMQTPLSQEQIEFASKFKAMSEERRPAALQAHADGKVVGP